MTEPLVLPYAPRVGWQAATPLRRRMTVALPIVLLVITVLTVVAGQTSESASWQLIAWPVVVAAFVVVPVLTYALARVLRPHPDGTGRERRYRHCAAAVAGGWFMAALVIVIAWTIGWDEDQVNDAAGEVLFSATFALAGLAFWLGTISVIWGLVAALFRSMAARQASMVGSRLQD